MEERVVDYLGDVLDKDVPEGRVTVKADINHPEIRVYVKEADLEDVDNDDTDEISEIASDAMREIVQERAENDLRMEVPRVLVSDESPPSGD